MYGRNWGWKANSSAMRQQKSDKNRMDDMQRRQRESYQKQRTEHIQKQTSLKHTSKDSGYSNAEAPDNNPNNKYADEYQEFLLWKNMKRNSSNNPERDVQTYSSTEYRK